MDAISPAKVFARSPPGVIWLGAKQREALKHLETTRPLRVLLGPPSSGKSTILHHFQRQVDDLVALPVVASQKSAAGVLASLLTFVGLGPWTLSEVEQRNLLTVFARQRSMQGKRVVLCVDDLSHLTPDAWSEIDRLRLLKLGNDQALELVLVGREEDAARPPLFDLLQDGATSAVEAVHYVSAPSDGDVGAYVEWRFAQSNLSNPFTADACTALNALTRGRWSFINILCQVAMLAQHRESLDIVDAPLVQQAAESLAAMKPSATATGDTIRTHRLVDEAPRPTDRLVVSCSGQVVKTVPLQGRLLIGRDADNDLQLPGRFMSRHHAAVMPTAEGHYYIIDFDSANGLRVNRRRINRCLLRDGDVIEVGQFRIKVEIPERSLEEVPFTLPDTSGETDLVPVPSFEQPVVRAIKN